MTKREESDMRTAALQLEAAAAQLSTTAAAMAQAVPAIVGKVRDAEAALDAVKAKAAKAKADATAKIGRESLAQAKTLGEEATRVGRHLDGLLGKLSRAKDVLQ